MAVRDSGAEGGRWACLLAIIWTAAAAADPPPSTPVLTPEVPATIPDTSIPVVGCLKPKLPDVLKKTAAKELKEIEPQIKAYGDCVHQFVEERRAKALIYLTLQNSELAASNEAVKLVNAYFVSVREMQEKLQPPPAPKGGSP
jgi:hypothetical protein